MKAMAKWGVPVGIAVMVIAALYLAWIVLSGTYSNDTLVGALVAALVGLVIYLFGERARLTSALNNDS